MLFEEHLEPVDTILATGFQNFQNHIHIYLQHVTGNVEFVFTGSEMLGEG